MFRFRFDFRKRSIYRPPPRPRINPRVHFGGANGWRFECLGSVRKYFGNLPSFGITYGILLFAVRHSRLDYLVPPSHEPHASFN